MECNQDHGVILSWSQESKTQHASVEFFIFIAEPNEI